MKKLRTVFMGTPNFAIESLKYIYENTDLRLIVTKEDKVNKRGNVIEYLPVKKYAIENNIEYIQPKTIRDEDFENRIKEINPDVIIVVAYGKIIPNNIINIPKHIINVHSSLLPKYRGASPIHTAIINGDSKTGVSIMYIEETLDSGDIITQKEIDILETDNLGTLEKKLSLLGKEALQEAIELIKKDNVVRIKQDESKVTFTKLIKKEDTFVNFNKTKEEIYNLVRGLNPQPLAYTILNGKIIKIIEIEKSNECFENSKNGEVVKINKDGIFVKVDKGSIILKVLKFEGKKEQKILDIINGRKIKLNDMLGV